MQAHFFDFCDPISSTAFLATFIYACDTKHMLKNVATVLVLIFVQNAPTTTLNRQMSAPTHMEPVATTVSLVEPTTQSKRPYF